MTRHHTKTTHLITTYVNITWPYASRHTPTHNTPIYNNTWQHAPIYTNMHRYTTAYTHVLPPHRNIVHFIQHIPHHITRKHETTHHILSQCNAPHVTYTQPTHMQQHTTTHHIITRHNPPFAGLYYDTPIHTHPTTQHTTQYYTIIYHTTHAYIHHTCHNTTPALHIIPSYQNTLHTTAHKYNTY